MSDIDIPFNDWSSERHGQRRKRATTRTKRYGDPGDQFTDAGFVYELTHVVKVPLEVVAEHFHEEEGADDMAEFVEVWNDIHYRRGFDREWPVWLHLYREVRTRPLMDFVEDVEGEFVGHCDECGMPLTDEEAVELGHGTYCEFHAMDYQGADA